MKSLINNTPADESYDTMAELVGAMTKGLMEKDKLAPPLVGGILGTVQVYRYMICTRSFLPRFACLLLPITSTPVDTLRAMTGYAVGSGGPARSS